MAEKPSPANMRVGPTDGLWRVVISGDQFVDTTG